MLHLNSKGYTFDDKAGGGQDPVEELKGLLAAEVSCLNSFEQCLNTPAAASLHTVASACRDLHTFNVQLLRERLTELGGVEPDSPDLWHSLLELVGTATAVLGEEAILGALRKHEMALLSEYESKIGCFDSENLSLVQEHLLPNQVKILELLGGVKSDMAEAIGDTNMPLNLNWA